MTQASAGFSLDPRRLLRPALPALFAAMIVLGRFDRFAEFGVLHYSLLSLLLILILFELMELMSPEPGARQSWLRLGLWILIAARVAVQATGGMWSPLYPLIYLIFALVVSTVRIAPAAALGAGLLGIEAGWILVNDRAGSSWGAFAVHSVFLILFGLAVGVVIQLERRGRRRASRALDRLKRDVHELAKDDTVFKLSGLTESGRKRSALRSVFQLDEAFYSALARGREFLAADALALYWRSAPEEGFHLREISTLRDRVNSENQVIAGQGFLGRAEGQDRPAQSSGKQRSGESLPYFDPPRPFAHALSVPVISGDWAQGLLVADRDQGGGFSDQDEKLMQSLAGQVMELHQHAALLKRSEAEAAQSRALAELAHRLSRTLDRDEILDAVMRTSQVIGGGDAQALILGEEDREGQCLVRVSGEMDPGSQGRSPTPAGSLAGWVMNEKQRLVISDLAARGRRTPVIEKRLDPPGMGSALILPLPLREFPPGALVVFSRHPDFFNRHVLQALGLLSDLATVSLQNALLHGQAQKRAITDGLTGLYNHRWLQERLDEELERAGRLGHRIALALCDIDHFKRVNDTYGHPLGDEVLRRVAGALKDSLRKVDAAARYGGEEFGLILVGTDAAGALELAERIRKRTAKMLFHAQGREFKVSLSVGIAVYPDDAQDKERLIELADQALYQAKETGRNRTMIASQLAARKRPRPVSISAAGRSR